MFVKEFAAKNINFRNKFMIMFADYDKRDNSDKYEQIVDRIFSSAEDWYGYIDYHFTSGAINQVLALLTKADKYIEKENYKEAFYIASAVASRCIEALQNLDDSSGECSGAINYAFGVISKIFTSEANAATKNDAFDWVLNEAENSDYDDYGCADELYPLLVEAADSSEKATIVLAFIDKQLEEISLKEGWSSEYNTRKFLSLKIDVLIKSGHEDIATNIIANNMHIHEFRKIVVMKYLEESNFNEAIRLIMEGISIADNGNLSGVVVNWKEMLMDIYKQQNNVNELQNIIKELYASSRHEMKYYREYKSTFNKDEWSTELDCILKSIKISNNGGFNLYKISSYNLALIYIEEEMWSGLLELLQNNSSIQLLLKFSHYLEKDYASALVPLYKNVIIYEANRVSDRNGYRLIASYILQMSKIQGGKEPARVIVSQLLEKYNKRPAMKDELMKIQSTW